jgi:hypothetical protein
MYHLTLQDVTTYEDCPIQCLSSPSTGLKEIDEESTRYIMLSTLLRKRPEILFYHSLVPPLEVDRSSIRPQPHFEIETETVLRASGEKDIPTRILEVTNKLIEVEETFKVLDKKKVEDFLRNIEKNIPFEQLEILSDDEILARVKKALGVELMCGLLNDLSEEQIMTFESTIKRRGLFK